MITPFACPHDRLPLRHEGRALVCATGHSFDLAREGHANLILPGQRSSRDPGDSVAMVAARRAFLSTGAYAPLADAVENEIATHARTGGLRRIVDSGCGEGYYLDHIARRAAADGWPGGLELAGIDISRPAIKAATKRSLIPGMPVQWAIANARHLPFADQSVDLILCLFGFPIWPEFRRVQRPGGLVLLADPGPDHLIELRRLIYPEVRRSEPPSLGAAELAGYRPTKKCTVRFAAVLTSPDTIKNLVAMTPHAHRMSPAAEAALGPITQLSVTVEVVLRHLEASDVA